MITTLTHQYGLTARPVAPVVPAVMTNRPCGSSYQVHTATAMGWLDGIGSKMNVSEVFASKRPTTRPLAEALT